MEDHPGQDRLISKFLADERLPDSFRATLQNWYLPLATTLVARLHQGSPPLVVGINGAQGTGKSTLARFLTKALEADYRVANLSIDDFYLDSRRRQILAKTVHPLLASRGVPGTHDVRLLNSLTSRLLEPDEAGLVQIPRFDKATDEPLPQEHWDLLNLPVDIVILEGWFVGAVPQQPGALTEPVNTLEQQEDSDGIWRSFVNQQLGKYQAVFGVIDYLIQLKAPDFDCVYAWRSLQEKKLAEGAGPEGPGIMNEVELARFIQHFERLTRHCLSELPARADLVLHLDPRHTITHSSTPASKNNNQLS